MTESLSERVEWRNVFRDIYGDEQVQPIGFSTRELLDELTDTVGRIAVERITITKRVERFPVPEEER